MILEIKSYRAPTAPVSGKQSSASIKPASMQKTKRPTLRERLTCLLNLCGEADNLKQDNFLKMPGAPTSCSCSLKTYDLIHLLTMVSVLCEKINNHEIYQDNDIASLSSLNEFIVPVFVPHLELKAFNRRMQILKNIFPSEISSIIAKYANCAVVFLFEFKLNLCRLRDKKSSFEEESYQVLDLFQKFEASHLNQEEFAWKFIETVFAAEYT